MWSTWKISSNSNQVLVEFAEIGILSLRHFDLQEVSTGVPTQESSGPKERLLGHGLAGISRREARNARVAVRQLVSAEAGHFQLPHVKRMLKCVVAHPNRWLKSLGLR